MAITRTLPVVAIHGELDPPEVAEGATMPPPEAVIVAVDAAGQRIEIQPATWDEAAQFKGAETITVSIDVAD